MQIDLTVSLGLRVAELLVGKIFLAELGGIV